MKTNGIILSVAFILVILVLVPSVNMQMPQYGTISGSVLDKYGNEIPNATIGLWDNIRGDFYSIPQNPQYTKGNGDGISGGEFQFSHVQYGSYTLIVEVVNSAGDLHNNTSIFDLNASQMIVNIVISEMETASPIPSLNPTQIPPHTPPQIPTKIPTPTPTPSQIPTYFLMLLICSVGLLLVVIALKYK